jgi:hypothetical protein
MTNKELLNGLCGCSSTCRFGSLCQLGYYQNLGEDQTRTIKMPWTMGQHRLFEFVKHNPEKAHAKGIKISQSDASRMASEGIKNEKTGKKPSRTKTR